MSRQRSNGGKSFAIGAIFGGIVAGITALMFAPKPGDKMRKEVGKKCRDVSCKTQDFLEDVCDQTCELVEKAKDIAYSAKEAASKIYRKD